uniref:Uncharacterized protein n=1 Tax=Sphaerodactylus townsendi TaxID=933632 RepID=A0ACB8FPV8_9SAUR
MKAYEVTVKTIKILLILNISLSDFNAFPTWLSSQETKLTSILPKVKSQNKFLCLFFTISFLKHCCAYIFPIPSFSIALGSFNTHKNIPLLNIFCSLITKSFDIFSHNVLVH